MKENPLSADAKAKIARRAYTHLIQLTKPPAQAFRDLHDRKKAHAENRAKHPPKPKPEAKKEENKDEKRLAKNDKTTPKSKDK